MLRSRSTRGGPVRLEFVVRPPLGAGPSPGSGRPNGHCSARHGPPCGRQRRSTACGPSTTRGCVPRCRRPDARRHVTLPQSWIQRENWEFETHSFEITASVVLGCRCRSKNFPDLSKQQSPTERDRTGICQRVSGLTHWNWSTSAGDSSLSASKYKSRGCRPRLPAYQTLHSKPSMTVSPSSECSWPTR